MNNIYDKQYNFRLLWPCIMHVGWRERNQQDATNPMFIIKIYLNMFRASLRPSSGEQERALPHMVLCTGCDGCGYVELGRELCALWKLLFLFLRPTFVMQGHKSLKFTLYNCHVWLCLVFDWLISRHLGTATHSNAAIFQRSLWYYHTSYIFCLNTLSHIQAVVSNVTYMQDNRVPFVKALKWGLNSELYIVIIPCHRLAAGQTVKNCWI